MIADNVKECTRKHSKLTHYREQALLEKLQGTINTTTQITEIQDATQQMREILEQREKRMAENRNINYEMLGQKGTKLYYASLKAKTTKKKYIILAQT